MNEVIGMDDMYLEREAKLKSDVILHGKKIDKINSFIRRYFKILYIDSISLTGNGVIYFKVSDDIRMRYNKKNLKVFNNGINLYYIYNPENKIIDDPYPEDEYECDKNGNSIYINATQYKNSNHEMFRELERILKNIDAIKNVYKKYYRLMFSTNYLQCLTFLLCAKKTFPRDIAKLIAHKILFFLGWPLGPFLNKKTKKARRANPKKQKN